MRAKVKERTNKGTTWPGGAASAQKRLRWLVEELVYQRLSALDREELTKLGRLVDAYIRSVSSPMAPLHPATQKDLEESQEMLRPVLESLAVGLAGEIALRLTVRYDKNPRHDTVAPDFLTSVPVSVLLTTCGLLREVPPSLLRRCAYRKSGDRCDRVFIARKRQKWCVDHQRIVRREQLYRALQRYRTMIAARRNRHV